MNWDKARLAVYIGGLLASLGFVLSALGYATYNAQTGDIDILPFNIYWLAGIIAGPVSSGLAALAIWLKWGKK